MCWELFPKKKLNDGTFNPNSNVSNKSIVNPFYARIIVQNIFFCCCQNFKIKMRENSGHNFYVWIMGNSGFCSGSHLVLRFEVGIRSLLLMLKTVVFKIHYESYTFTVNHPPVNFSQSDKILIHLLV
jgi:hypothetical protein